MLEYSGPCLKVFHIDNQRHLNFDSTSPYLVTIHIACLLNLLLIIKATLFLAPIHVARGSPIIDPE